MLHRVIVVMPAYNAGQTVERVFARIPAAVRARLTGYVVVDDGSRDDTAEAVQRLQATGEYPGLELLRHPENRGYGEAEKTLLRRAVALDCDAAVLLHADGQYSPEKIPAMLEPVEQGRCDVVMGSRLAGGLHGAVRGNMPLYKVAANAALTGLENWAFGLGLSEYHSGFLVYNRRALATIPYERLSNSFDFDLEMVVLAKVKGLRVGEVAIPTIYADERSHLNPIRYGLDVLGVVWDYKRGKYHAL